jgi:hypothetical protein
MNFYLMISIEFGPQVIRRLVDQLDPADWDRRLNPDRFTPREVVAHVADWEPIMRGRIRTALREPGSPILAYDEGQLALDHKYSETDPVEQAEAFIRERRTTAELLRQIDSEEEWQRVATHPERGSQSVEDQANLLLGHDLYHIEQLAEYLARK